MTQIFNAQTKEIVRVATAAEVSFYVNATDYPMDVVSGACFDLAFPVYLA